MENKEIQDPQLAFITESYTQETGAGFACDVLLLNDGTVLVVGEDSVVLYKDTEAWENDPSRQEGFIIRPQNTAEQPTAEQPR
jgi:hypothetical protein